MVDESNFIVRISGKKANSYYIDYSGKYKISEIAGVAGIKQDTAKDIYIQNGAAYDKTMDVYYFDSIEAAKKAIMGITSNIRTDQRGKLIFLTMTEVEYIRKALINEESNIINIKSSIKDKIFKKLNS